VSATIRLKGLLFDIRYQGAVLVAVQKQTRV